jgi:hypothetical protein
MTNVERTADALYSPGGVHQAGNVKFFRGLATDVTAEQLAQQLELANQQIADRVAVRVVNVDAEVIEAA